VQRGALHNLTSLERINNHTKGIVRQAEELRDGNLEYSEEAASLLRDISEKKVHVFDEAIRALTLNEPKHAERALQGADEVEALREDYTAGHLERVADGTHCVKSGNVFMLAVHHMSKIARHSKDIAETASGDDK
jgi:Na+/phosphate symporter